MGDTYIELSLSFDGSSSKSFMLDPLMTISGLKAHISLLLDMSTGSHFDQSELVIQCMGKPVEETTELGSLPPDVLLNISTKGDRVVRLDQDSVDITSLIQKFREITRDDIPSAKQRHLIQEHQRKASAAVADALTRSRKGSLVLPAVPESSSVSDVRNDFGPLYYLRSSLEGLVDLVERGAPAPSEAATQAVSDFADALASSVSVDQVHDDQAESESLKLLLEARPVDRQRFASAIMVLCRLPVNSCTKSQEAAQNELVLLLERTSDISAISEAIVTLVTSISGSLNSPTSSGLLPVPTERASPSPELLRWAQGLTPKHRG